MQPQTKTATVISAFAQSVKDDLKAAPQPIAMGMMYINNAVPMKGARPDADGKCFFLMECFPIDAGKTPGQIAQMVLDKKDAEYRVYHGHISHKKGEAGVVIGYIYNCYGTENLSFAANVDDTMRGPVMTRTDFMCLRNPRVAYSDTSAPRYGAYNHQIQGYDEQIATEATIHAVRYPAPKSPFRRSSII